VVLSQAVVETIDSRFAPDSELQLSCIIAPNGVVPARDYPTRCRQNAICYLPLRWRPPRYAVVTQPAIVQYPGGATRSTAASTAKRYSGRRETVFSGGAKRSGNKRGHTRCVTGVPAGDHKGENAMTFGIPVMKQALAAAVTLAAMAGAAMAEPLDYTRLNLLNGWARYSLDTRLPSVALDSNNVVHLRGAIYQASGATAIVFVLPITYRPQSTVYVSVGLINGKPGRLIIHSDGTVFVQSAGSYADAQNFTSLEGVTYPRR
jgi:hypothetical protein